MSSNLDPRDEPNYTLDEVAAYLGLPVSTVRAWSVGQAHGTNVSPPLIRPALRRPPTLSFWNLVEIYVLAAIRRAHGIPLQKVRRALRYVQTHLDEPRPLIQKEFFTDGVHMFVEHYSKLINVSQEGQVALRDLLIGSLRRIERDPQGLARKVYPWLSAPDEAWSVEIDPERAFGRLVVAGTGIPTEALAERFRAGDTMKHLAKDYWLTEEQVEAALRWEQRAAAL